MLTCYMTCSLYTCDAEEFEYVFFFSLSRVLVDFLFRLPFPSIYEY